jgi:UDPglucose 6-dehydrogenase
MKIKNICCIGAGYVGGPTMAVIALKCPNINITVVDSNPDRIKAWNGPLDKLPIYEPGLSDVIKETRGKNLFFSDDIAGNIEKAEIIFMAVNTPTKTEGEGAGMAADLSHVEHCARDIAKYSKSDKIVVEKSTLPVRTAEKIKEILEENSDNIHFEILSNPEFLAEGTAIQDLFKSDRVLIGGDPTETGQKAVQALVEIYSKWIPREKILTSNVWSSELSKLASNAMLAQRISSINSLSALCEKTGANIGELSKAIGMDHRIGPKFLNASVGFGGSCFQKDILNLVYIARNYGLEEVAEYWHQVIKINDYQKERFASNIIKLIDDKTDNAKVSVLGWAFKKNTNDSRESASIYVTDILLKNKIPVNVYDPLVSKDKIILDMRKLWSSQKLSLAKTEHLLSGLKIKTNYFDAIKGSSLVAILTEWDEFKGYDWKKLVNNMIKPSIVYDGRNLLPIQDESVNHITLGIKK